MADPDAEGSRTPDGIKGPLESQGPEEKSVESTVRLLIRARTGDEKARNQLFRRYLPPFQRWAHGRLPTFARDLYETDDLVQVTLIKALSKLDEFEPRREGAFLAYLRQILMNKIRDEIRRTKRRPAQQTLGEDLPGASRSPLENAMNEETLMRYEKALSQLSEGTREAIVMRIELGFTYQEIADATDCPSWNAARMRISRGLVQLWEAMNVTGK